MDRRDQRRPKPRQRRAARSAYAAVADVAGAAPSARGRRNHTNMSHEILCRTVMSIARRRDRDAAPIDASPASINESDRASPHGRAAERRLLARDARPAPTPRRPRWHLPIIDCTRAASSRDASARRSFDGALACADRRASRSHVLSRRSLLAASRSASRVAAPHTAAASDAARRAQRRAAARPPFPTAPTSVLPSWLRVRGEFRERIEGFDGLGFVDDARRRLLPQPLPPQRDGHAGADCSSFQVQVQDARVGEQDRRPDRHAVPRRRSICAWRSPTSATRKTPRRRCASAARSWPSASSGWSATSAGSTPARTFDAARVTVRGEGAAGRRLRRLGRAHPRRRVRQERQRQPLRRRLRDDADADAAGVGRAVRRSGGAT